MEESQRGGSSLDPPDSPSDTEEEQEAAEGKDHKGECHCLLAADPVNHPQGHKNPWRRRRRSRRGALRPFHHHQCLGTSVNPSRLQEKWSPLQHGSVASHWFQVGLSAFLNLLAKSDQRTSSPRAISKSRICMGCTHLQADSTTLDGFTEVKGGSLISPCNLPPKDFGMIWESEVGASRP